MCKVLPKHGQTKSTSKNCGTIYITIQEMISNFNRTVSIFIYHFTQYKVRHFHHSHDFSSGWWFQPLWKIWKSVGMSIPYMKWKIIQPCLKPPTSGSRSAGHSKTLFKLQLHPPQLQIRSRWCRSFCHSSIKPLDPVPSTLLLTGLYLTMIQTVV